MDYICIINHSILILSKINVTKKKQFLSLKQAKFDVFKFGIKGFSKEEQESANIKLAMKLGASVIINFVIFFISGTRNIGD